MRFRFYYEDQARTGNDLFTDVVNEPGMASAITLIESAGAKSGCTWVAIEPDPWMPGFVPSPRLIWDRVIFLRKRLNPGAFNSKLPPWHKALLYTPQAPLSAALPANNSSAPVSTVKRVRKVAPPPATDESHVDAVRYMQGEWDEPKPVETKDVYVPFWWEKRHVNVEAAWRATLIAAGDQRRGD